MKKFTAQSLLPLLSGAPNGIRLEIETEPKGQSAAGTRVRKGLSELKRLAQDMRNEIQEVKAQRKEAKTQ